MERNGTVMCRSTSQFVNCNDCEKPKIGTNNRIDKIDLTPKYKKPLDYKP